MESRISSMNGFRISVTNFVNERVTVTSKEPLLKPFYFCLDVLLKSLSQNSSDNTRGGAFLRKSIGKHQGHI